MTKMIVTMMLWLLIFTTCGCEQFMSTVMDMGVPSNPITGSWEVDMESGEITIRPTLSDRITTPQNDNLFVGVWEWITASGIPVRDVLDAPQGVTAKLIWTFFDDNTWELDFIRNDQLIATEFGTYTLTATGNNYTMISQSSEFILDKGDLFAGTYRKEGDRLLLTESGGGELVLVRQ